MIHGRAINHRYTLKGAESAFQDAKCDGIKKPLNGKIYTAN